MHVNKHTGPTPYAVYFALFMNAGLASLYGLLIDNSTVFLVNAVNCVAAVYFLYVYYQYTKQPEKVRAIFIAGVVALLVVWYRISTDPSESTRVQLGVLSNIATIAMFAAPLSTMVT